MYVSVVYWPAPFVVRIRCWEVADGLLGGVQKGTGAPVWRLADGRLSVDGWGTTKNSGYENILVAAVAAIVLPFT